MTYHKWKYCGLFALILVAGIVDVVILYNGASVFPPAVEELPSFEDCGLKISFLPNGKMHPTIKRRMKNLVLLDSHPEKIEPELASGRWLVLVYAVYNSQDNIMQRKTAAIAKRLSGICRVAIRPTDGFEDISKWLPQSEGRYEEFHPVWFALENGEILGTTGLWRSEAEIEKFVERAFGARGNMPREQSVD